LLSDVSNGSLILNSDGSFSYTHDGSENFSDSFTYRITDNDGQISDGVVTINITPVSDSTPSANADSISLGEGGTATALVGGASTVLNNDTGLSDTPVTVSLLSDVSNGSLILNSDGSFSYTHDGSENFSDSFTYRITDNDGQTSDAVVTIDITPVSDSAPIAHADSISLAEGGTATALVGGASSVISNDAGLSDTPVTVSLLSDVSNGSLTLNSDGSFSYTHDGSENFSDSFTYRITDNDGQTSDATVNIAVTPVNEAPVITSHSGNADVVLSLSENHVTVTTVSANDADGDSLTFAIDGGVDIGLFRIDASSGDLVFINTPDAENPGDSNQDNVYQVVVLVSDSNGGSDRQSFTVEITDVDEFDVGLLTDLDDAPDSITPLNVVDNPIGITAWGEDQDVANNLVTYSLDADAGGIFTIDPSSGVITLASSIATQDVNEFQVTVRASSEDGSFSVRTFNITLQRWIDLPTEPEEIYLDEIIYDLDPMETEEPGQTPVSPLEIYDDPLPVSSSVSDIDEDEGVGEDSGSIPQADLQDPTQSVDEAHTFALDMSVDRDSSNYNYAKLQFMPAAVAMNELPQFNTISDELIEVPKSLWNLLDVMNQQMSEHQNEDAAGDGLILQSATVGTLALSAGYVTWLLRAGVLSASLLSSAPLWRQVDPLPVLSARAKRREEEQQAVTDTDPLERRLSKLFERNNKSRRAQAVNSRKM
jgi:VCBS repeat-containing protein